MTVHTPEEIRLTSRLFSHPRGAVLRELQPKDPQSGERPIGRPRERAGWPMRDWSNDRNLLQLP